ncbi:MAG: hypothetical protein IPM02_14265 [Betaproteobacteria bacterium]|nr:hypothetical protein [Betaproteobacteria bacterium]
MDILQAMQDSKFVQVNGQMFVTGYLCLPDDSLVGDDIVLEATSEDAEYELTFSEVRDADQIGPGVYRLKSGAILCFLSSATVH